ncbi:hypothetical protein DVR09_00370 [Erythrobacter aureus]|uniref:Uncharacterized protein n=1 Tax=Erythrobacter aureus TaxID=2182384 RepID=A0A345YAN7_9SPHN|nr:hypothetical protein DVR09_00370 [Erythrobacter aureus]
MRRYGRVRARWLAQSRSVEPRSPSRGMVSEPVGDFDAASIGSAPKAFGPPARSWKTCAPEWTK